MKIFRRTRSWLLIIGMIVVTFVTLLVVDNLTTGTQGSSDWRVNVQKQIEADQAQMENPNYPAHMMEGLHQQIALNQYRLAHDVPPTDRTMWGYLLTAAKLMMVATIFTVVASADSVAGEFSGGTIKLLLIRPYYRWQILLAKYASAVLFSLLLLLVTAVTAFICSGMLAGFQDMSIPYLYLTSNGAIQETNMVQHVVSTYGYQGVQMLMIVTMAFMISTVFRSSAVAIALSIGLMFIGTTVAPFITSYRWAKYVLFENIDLTGYLVGAPPIEGMTLSFSIAVLAVYYTIFLVSTLLVFQRRDIAN
ncbi:MAG TPA: ABC transporter permease [Bacilli bacterium]|nr:ABC transporter permease [Bacilli bacterium]